MRNPKWIPKLFPGFYEYQRKRIEDAVRDLDRLHTPQPDLRWYDSPYAERDEPKLIND